ncbi:oligosaccharide flippase family protein [Fictibacillus aquaticus]|uniref:Sugar translocase n=1 Tax=Fictibacillus aquaticus TaxID=2021314 RepID=A0A235F971_9BACL|nr:oligosaccharide flippase family protein [Fictibacillus aquaticus]OYD57719.1 hypothetical protein CGZ90_13730 [Fictibacillus aquaticus]
MARNSIGRNIFHLFYSTALASALNAGALIVLAGYLQAEHYGQFSVALACAMILGYFTDSGLSEMALREGSKKNADVPGVLASYIKVRLLLLAASFLVGFVIIWLVYGGNSSLMMTAMVLCIPMVTGLALQSIAAAYFQMTEQMQYIGRVRMASSFVLVSLLSGGMLLKLGPVAITLLYGCSYLAAGMFGLWLVMKNVRIPMHAPFHKTLLHGFGYFTLAGLLFIILPHIGPLVLERTMTLADVAFFAVAYRIPQALQQIPFIVAGAYRPVMFRLYHEKNDTDHVRTNISLVKWMAVFGMVLTIPFFYLSDEAVSVLFGAEWSASAELLQILSIMLTVQAVNIALADGLTTRGRQTYRTLVQGMSVAIGVILYIVCSKLYGLQGAAYAGLAIEIIALAGYWLFLPSKMEIAKRAVLPYLAFLTGSTAAVHAILGSFPFAAAAIHLSLLGCFVMLDKEIYGQIIVKVRGKEAGHGA